MMRTNSSNPYFSIVIPAFNRETEIVRALDSCLNQSFQDIEVLVVDDAITQRSQIKELLKRQMFTVCPSIHHSAFPPTFSAISFKASSQYLPS